ncbi:MAG: hypothetical protein QFX36_04090 [Archaeoglobales archaeon]|nr:hypothetical protein [Archaeoglobales archaeon]
MASKEVFVKCIKISDSETVKRFEEIKEQLGLRNDSEVLRFLVNRFYRIINKGLIDVDADLEIL